MWQYFLELPENLDQKNELSKENLTIRDFLQEERVFDFQRHQLVENGFRERTFQQLKVLNPVAIRSQNVN